MMRIKVIILLLALFAVSSFFNSELSGAAGSSCISDSCVEMAYFECVNGSLVNRSYVIGRCGVECTANGCNRLFWSFKCVNNVKVMSVKVPGDTGYTFGCNDSRTFQCWVDGSSWDRGLVVGRCGVECVNEGEESCDGKELIVCEGNKKINKGKIDNKCGVVFLNISLSVGEWNVNNGYDDTDNSLVLSLHLDNRSSLGENSTYVVDSSGEGNNGTLYGAVVNSSGGRYGWGAYFDGINDYIQTNSNSQSVQNFTVGLWVNPKSGQEANANMIGQSATTYGSPKNGGWNIIWQTTVWKFMWVYSSTEVTSQPVGVTLTPNTWSYITATKNEGNASVYVNGVLQESFIGASPTIYYENPFPVILGAWYSNYDRNFNGLIDEVRIYNRSLSASEVLALYQNQSSTFYPKGQQEYKTFNATLTNKSRLNVKVDSDGDGSVSLNELTNYIQKWIEGDVSLNSLTNAIQEWIASG